MTVDLHYKSIGEGPTVLILHGLFGSLDNWQSFAKKFSKSGFRVVTVDLRNHGKSPHNELMGLEIMAEDVYQFIKDQQLGPCYVLGHSMGGKTAMVLSLNHPEVVSKLAVLDIAPRPYSPHHNSYFESLSRLDLNSIISRREAQEELGKTVKSNSVLQFLLKNLQRNNEGNYEWKFNLDALYKYYPELIEGIYSERPFTKPTLFIAGQKSDYISPKDEMHIKELFPNSELVIIPDAGHWVHAENPEKLEEVLIGFFNES